MSAESHHHHGHKGAHHDDSHGRHYFDDTAAAYDRIEWIGKLSNLIVDMAKKQSWYRKGIRLLEFGCGTGNNSLAFVDVVVSAVGVDISSKMLEKFNEKIIAEGLKDRYRTQQLLKGDGSELDKNAYDLVLCPYVLHHVSDQNAVFRNLIESMVPGGYLIVGEFEHVDMSDDKKKEKHVHRWVTEKDIDLLCQRNHAEKMDVRRTKMEHEKKTYEVIVCVVRKPC